MGGKVKGGGVVNVIFASPVREHELTCHPPPLLLLLHLRDDDLIGFSREMISFNFEAELRRRGAIHREPQWK